MKLAFFESLDTHTRAAFHSKLFLFFLAVSGEKRSDAV